MAIHSIPALPAREDDPASIPGTSTSTGAARPALNRRAWLAAGPVVLVNLVAFFGQLAFLRAHLPWPWPGQILVAVALESVAVYLAYHAHVAQLADDSALRLRLAAYSFALVIGAMNFSHYAVHWRPTFAAVAFGLMSAASPWLWSIHSRRESRDALMARGLVEPHAVRLGATRWAWHPCRSAVVMWHATWKGVNDPAAAIALAAAAELPEIGIDAAVLSQMTHKERLILAFGTIGELSVPKALAVLKDRGAPVDQSTAYQIRKALGPAASGDAP